MGDPTDMFCWNSSTVVDEQKISSTPCMLSCGLLTHAVSIENKTKDFIWYANFLHLKFGTCSPIVKSSQNILHVINLWCCTWLECPEFYSTLTSPVSLFGTYENFQSHCHLWRVFIDVCVFLEGSTRKSFQ